MFDWKISSKTKTYLSKNIHGNLVKFNNKFCNDNIKKCYNVTNLIEYNRNNLWYLVILIKIVETHLRKSQSNRIEKTHWFY